jgi:hypothetical protein
MSTLARPELLKLAVEASRDPKTVQAVLDGGGNDQSRAAVLAAAQRLGLPTTIVGARKP